MFLEFHSSTKPVWINIDHIVSFTGYSDQGSTITLTGKGTVAIDERPQQILDILAKVPHGS